MKLNIKQINYNEANQISKWIYEEPYSIYSMDESDDCIDELLNNPYFSVTDRENNLLGYYCFGESAQVPVGRQFGVYDDKDVTDIGLGMKPNLCGQGLGFGFLNSGLEFARNQLSAKRFRLTVAAFNKRAIKVYERIGFKKVNSFKRKSGTGEIEFWVMILS
ncbi:GNAT family N-acetyltransferase [Brassicibacter mesophilus]|uniref:GNAT family N-acetyltransferase n=1 Tax=Brassicibacter mesophilus TaxID=745119 RepID=UPI003D1F4FF2